MLGFGRKCAFCREKIEGNGIKKAVRRPGYVGTFTKDFCCEEHAEKYAEHAECMAEAQKTGSCCR